MGHVALFSETVTTGSELQFTNTSFEYVFRAVSAIVLYTSALATSHGSDKV